MYKKIIDVIIPAYNEEDAIAHVIYALPKSLLRNIIVVCNSCTDKTASVAEKAGALVLHESKKGYGWACLKGIDYCSANPPDILVFLDGDYSDYPEEILQLVDPIIHSEVDVVIGSRTKGKIEKGALPIHQRWGNKLATTLIRLIYKEQFSDLGPFRAIKFKRLLELNMTDKTYGWTIEMQIKVIQHNISWLEIPVNYRQRIGKSKVSGTFKGSILAGYRIIYTIFKYTRSRSKNRK